MTTGELESLLRTKVIEAQPPITGGVYFKEMRPRQQDGGSRLEDCEVMVLTGSGSELVSGTCVVNIYVPDTLTASGLYLRSKKRTDELEAWLHELPTKIRSGEVYFTRDGMVSTLKEESTHEHFVSLKMKFKVLENLY